jgi:AraC family transcriptional regulator of arabinose operon
MTKTATLSPFQQAAKHCYHWYTSAPDDSLVPDEGLPVLQAIIGSPMSAEELLHFGNKLRQSEDFPALRDKLADKWHESIGARAAPDEEDAHAFILELFSEVDHAVIYDHGINAGSSHYERGAISDSELRILSGMPCWTLHLTVEGSALFLNENMEAQVGRGDMMLFHPDASYHYGIHPGAEHWGHLWVLFQPRPHWGEWMEWEALDDGVLRLPCPDSDNVIAIEKLFRQLLILSDNAGPYQCDLQYNRLEEIIIRARGCNSREHTKRPDPRIEHACEYMQGHVEQKFSVEDVASACNLSPSRMAHLFKEHMGVSLKSWSSSLRLQQARKKLLNSNDSVSQIARQVGYDDPSQFTKYFKKSLGCSPRSFRQSFRGH